MSSYFSLSGTTQTRNHSTTFCLPTMKRLMGSTLSLFCYTHLLNPLQCTFPPGVKQSDDKDHDEEHSFQDGKEGNLVESYCPWV